jgi:hypothetical protein
MIIVDEGKSPEPITLLGASPVSAEYNSAQQDEGIKPYIPATKMFTESSVYQEDDPLDYDQNHLFGIASPG